MHGIVQRVLLTQSMKNHSPSSYIRLVSKFDHTLRILYAIFMSPTSHQPRRSVLNVITLGFVLDFNKVSTRIVASPTSRISHNALTIEERDDIRKQIDFDHGLDESFRRHHVVLFTVSFNQSLVRDFIRIQTHLQHHFRRMHCY